MGNGASPHGPSYRAHPRLYRTSPPAAQECLLTEVLRKLTAGAGACRRLYSGLMLAARITLAHFSVSSATSFPNPVGVIGMGSPPSSVRRACSFGSARNREVVADHQGRISGSWRTIRVWQA